MNKSQMMALALVGLVATAVVVGAVVYFALRLRGSGRIKTIGVKAFSDPEATLEISAIDWGEISPGGSAYVTIYLKSTSNAPINLTMHTENWAPANASDFLTLTWDYNNMTIAPAQVIAVTFTLNVDNAITGITDFAFDIVIVAAG